MLLDKKNILAYLPSGYISKSKACRLYGLKTEVLLLNKLTIN